MKKRKLEKYLTLCIYLLCAITFIPSCKQDLGQSLFQVRTHDQTGLEFANHLTPSLELNVFNYMYFYNGGGVGVADLNNDGLDDIVFTGNQVDNKVYLNKGELKFEDITEASGFFSDEGWSTGVAIHDINQDGLMDIYVSQVSEFRSISTHNLLFVCEHIDENGMPHYKEQAEVFGLDLKGFGTQAAFFDCDLDGDLDCFQLNHSLHQNGTFGQRKSFQNTYHDLSGDKMLRNDNGKFVDITKQSGINSSVIGYGLGLAVGDLNGDGLPDIYVGNDFHENDYMYLNTGDGTFTDQLTEQIMHTSRFSMGVDIADVNNDLKQDVFSLDMLPYDPFILKKSEGEDALDIFNFKLSYGYNHQYAKNNLQINNGNNTFSEVAMYSGIHATDWSWGALFVDMNNDGLKDLFVSNGIPRRMNDIDYINFMSDDEVQFRVQFENMVEEDLDLINSIPQIELPNKLFVNKGKLRFEDLESQISNNLPTYSNGLGYADFDLDGDIDFVVNNIDNHAMVYENLSSTVSLASSISVKLEGEKGNINGIGAKVFVYQDGKVQLHEKFPSRGFQSSVNSNIHIGIGNGKVDSIIVLWPKGGRSSIFDIQEGEIISVRENEALDVRLDKSMVLDTNSFVIRGRTGQLGVDYHHVENPFVEFNREPLIPHATSTDGPSLAIGDFNNDGREDFYVGSAKRKTSKLFLQTIDGKFEQKIAPIIRKDSIHEEVDALAIDLNDDGYDDLILVNGGNEYYYPDVAAMSRILMNDKKGGFERYYLDSIYGTFSCVEYLGKKSDGSFNLFLGGRAVSWAYGKTPKSYILNISPSMEIQDVTEVIAPGLKELGMILGSEIIDLDKDGDKDIILAMEWQRMKLLQNEGESYTLRNLNTEKGWWQFSKTADFDDDGDLDILVGNMGLNSRLKASKDEPISLYFNDFDGNGKEEQVLSYFLADREIPFSNMMEIEKQIPAVKKKFVKATEFAAAEMEEIFGKQSLSESKHLEANEFRNGILVNEGGSFKFRPLNYDMQMSTYKDAEIADFNNDGLPDILIAGNYYDNNIQMGRYDADFGSVLINEGNFNFRKLSPNNDLLKGQTRNIETIQSNGADFYVIAKNNDRLEIITIDSTN